MEDKVLTCAEVERWLRKEGRGDIGDEYTPYILHLSGCSACKRVVEYITKERGATKKRVRSRNKPSKA